MRNEVVLAKCYCSCPHFNLLLLKWWNSCNLLDYLEQQELTTYCRRCCWEVSFNTSSLVKWLLVKNKIGNDFYPYIKFAP